MRLSTIGLILILSLLTAPPAADAQQRGKVPRIGVLLPGSPTPDNERRLDAFRQGLRELGYIDTQNILLEYRWAHAQYMQGLRGVGSGSSMREAVIFREHDRRLEPLAASLCAPGRKQPVRFPCADRYETGSATEA